MEEPTTCGQGLAANASLPDTMAAVVASMAGVLDAHRAALSLADEAARQEDDAYRVLVDQLRASADRLRTTAAQMADCRDLPMGAHDMEAASSRQADAFTSFVHSERELVDLLQARVVRDEALLVGEDTGQA